MSVQRLIISQIHSFHNESLFVSFAFSPGDLKISFYTQMAVMLTRLSFSNHRENNPPTSSFRHKLNIFYCKVNLYRNS